MENLKPAERNRQQLNTYPLIFFRLKDSTRTYFEKHVHYSAYNKDPQYYLPLVEGIKKRRSERRIRVLDLGCGDGSFISGMIKAGVSADYIATDLSFNMTKMANEKLADRAVDLFVADGFRIPLKYDTQFDLIHIDSVLHHIIRGTRKSSSKLAKKLLDILAQRLAQDGIMIVEEMYFDSYLVPFITSSIVFYTLKVLNFINLDISKIKEDVKLGLEVNFFHDEQLRKMLKRYGAVHVFNRTPSKLSTLQKVCLLKDRGHISYMVTSDKEKMKS
jgi:SAM-dependent methyltransferase